MMGCVVEDNSAKIAKLKQEVEELKKEKQGQEDRKSDIFEKNLKCLGLREGIEKNLKEKDKEYTGEDYLESVFFSNELNTCVVVTRTENSQPGTTYKFLYTMENLDFSEEGIRECEGISPIRARLYYLAEGMTPTDENEKYWARRANGCDKFGQYVENLKNE